MKLRAEHDLKGALVMTFHVGEITVHELSSLRQFAVVSSDHQELT